MKIKWALKIKQGWIEQRPSRFLAAFIFLLIGIWLLGYGASLPEKEDRAYWPLVPATVSNIKINETICLGRPRVRFAEIHFDLSYVVNGKMYEEHFFDCASSVEGAQQTIEGYFRQEHLLEKSTRIENVKEREILIHYDPANPRDYMLKASDPPGWKYYFFGIIALLASFPYAVLIPLWNLCIAVWNNRGKKGPLALVRSVFPIGYSSKLHSVFNKTLDDLNYRGEYKFWYHTSISPYETGGVVHVTFSTNASLLKAKSSEWTKKLKETFQKRREASALPVVYHEKFRYEFHSQEEIDSVGGYDYWR